MQSEFLLKQSRIDKFADSFEQDYRAFVLSILLDFVQKGVYSLSTLWCYSPNTQEGESATQTCLKTMRLKKLGMLLKIKVTVILSFYVSE